MGSLFARLLTAAGATVHISDRDTPLDNAALAERCDLNLVAVPLRVTPAVLAELAPRLRPGAALASLGSLMEPSLPVLQECTGEAFLLHPLFGPGRKTLHGAALALAPLRAGPHGEWLLDVLRQQGAGIVETAPEQHDRAMAVAQALLHGSYAALAPQIMAALPGDDPLAWASPTLRLHLALMSRILHQNPRLYGDLLALNRHTPAAIDALTARLATLRAAVADGPDAVAALFTAARDALGAHGPALATEGDRALGEE
jgi:prephenate dehydrogenase